jgi:hypothetical protein
MMPNQIVLLGDSIFDNGAYTEGEPDVVRHLRGILPPSWRATLRAVDGSMTAGLPGQLPDVPPDSTHLVISVGGNDALSSRNLLARPVRSTAEALSLFSDRVEQFEGAYRAAIGEVLTLERDTTVCTIYNGNLDAKEARLARIALMMFNDVILRVAVEHALRVIDLRLVCTEAGDYANPIEPSGRGGRKIARAVARGLGAVEGEVRGALVFGG